MLKNKIIVRKIRNIVILLMAIIVMLGAYHNIRKSRAENVVQITAVALDNYGYLENEEFEIEAKSVKDNLYEIELPESINTKKVNQIIKVTLEDNTAAQANEQATTDTTSAQANEQATTDTSPAQATEAIQTTEETASQAEEVEIVENKIYLTEEQKANKQIKIEVEYDVAILEKNEQEEYSKTLLAQKTAEERATMEITEETEMLYGKILKYEDVENNKLVEVRGYLPIDAQLQIEEVLQDKLAEIFGDKKIDVAYDIKIIKQVITQVPVDEANPESEIEEIVETIEINPQDFGEICEVSIKDTNIEENSKVYHVKEDNTYEQVNVKENTEENITFEANTFSIYAVSANEDIVFQTQSAANGISTVLKSTSGETGPSSGFLGNTNIQRKYIESVTFKSSTAGAASNKWDVSAQGDGSIIAWYTGTSPYQVYIASDYDIYANPDSSYLFSYIGYDSSCTATSVINNLSLLNTSSVTTMGSMFLACGYTAMTSLNLGSNFDTSNVTYMVGMFTNCGKTAMTSLDLGDKFNTSKVTNMHDMFDSCGEDAMTSLDLGDNFDTSNVTNMELMFEQCGKTSMTSLDLGDKFDTSKVTSMRKMFSQCGLLSMTSFDLGDKFDTSNVTNMDGMFMGFSQVLPSLELGDKFYTSKVTNMYRMFNGMRKICNDLN